MSKDNLSFISKSHFQETSVAVQDYVKRCYRLENRLSRPVSLSELAKSMEVSAPSVTNMVKRLEQMKFVKRNAGNKLSLTTKGNALALEVIRHHRLLETFLINELGMDWAEAHEEAEVLEHYISERFEALLNARLAEPSHDPHGEPIPTLDGTIQDRELRALLEFERGNRVTIGEIHSRDPNMLDYLQKNGFIPGQKVEICDVAPFEGPLTLKIGRKISYVGRLAAASVYCFS